MMKEEPRWRQAAGAAGTAAPVRLREQSSSSVFFSAMIIIKLFIKAKFTSFPKSSMNCFLSVVPIFFRAA